MSDTRVETLSHFTISFSLKVIFFLIFEISRESFESVLPSKVWPIPDSTGGLVEKLISTFKVLVDTFCDNMIDLKKWCISNSDVKLFVTLAKKLKEFDEKVDHLAAVANC